MARAAGINILAFSNNPSVAGPGTYLLGVTPGTAANSLVSFARTR
ncbi:penicillin-binding protein activator, partial [Amaricoccus sp. HAR-UPW-R2A-40]